MGVTFALGIFAALPVPSPAMEVRRVAILLGLWFVAGALAWSSWYAPKTLGLWCGAGIALSFALWKMTGASLFLILFSCWGIWFLMRRSRETKTLALAFGAGLGLLSSFSEVHGKTVAKTKTLTNASLASLKMSSEAPAPLVPKYLSGNSLNDLSSCTAVDQIPWNFRAERKTRLLMRDTLRLNTEPQFATWEINQVMDKDGYVTYVFSKIEAGQRSQSLLVKDNIFNRIVNQKGKSKVTEVQDLRTLINRPVFVFLHSDGSSVSYSPGLAGQSVLTVELRQAAGRPLAPIYIRGSFCERAQGNVNSVDLQGTTRGGEATTDKASGNSGFSDGGT